MTDEQKARHKERMKAHYAANPEQYRKNRKDWKSKNRDRKNELNREYRKRNKSTLNARERELRKLKPKQELTPEQKAVRKAYSQKHYKKKSATIRARTTAYYRANREKCYERQLLWAKNNPDKVREIRKRAQSTDRHRQKAAIKAREWRAKNIEKVRARDAEYRKSEKYKARIARNREKRNEQCRIKYHTDPNRRAYLKSLARRSRGYFQVIERWKRVGRLCYICGNHLDENEICIDHVIPRAKGGGNEVSNLMPVHRKCNSNKRDIVDYPVKRKDLLVI